VFSRARTWFWHQIDRIRHKPMENDNPNWRADRTPVQVLTGRVQRPPQRQREVTPAMIGRHSGTRQADREAEM
jgi:hypothetical protein